MLLRLIVALLCVTQIAAYCPAFLRNQTACSCFDNFDGIVIKCNGPNGPVVVEQLKKTPLQIRELYLENANIVQIGRHAFKNLRIKKLVLDNNRIRALHQDAFRGLETVLQELSISHNKLTQVPTDSLIGMRALTVLSLKCNSIGNITTPIFRNVSSLIDLDLGCNKICTIEGPAFHDVKRTLQNLILDNNCLPSIPSDAVRNLDNLIGLHIKYNEIEKLEKLQLTNLSSLALLTLTGNKIDTVDKNVMPESKNLRYLFLGSNKLSKLPEGAIGQFSEVQVVDLSYNELSEITADMFSGLESLQNLNLEGNGIKDVAAGAFATTPLLLLWLPKNCISSVTPNMFQGAPFLRQVSLAHNNIRTIQPLSFAHLANLHTLDLSHNKIQVLQPGAITGSDHLTVRLQENPMVCSQDGYHVMNGRDAINLTSEPNLICKTDYTKDVDDVCPKKGFERPVPTPCCVKEKPQPKPVTTTTTTEEPSTAVPEAATQAEPQEADGGSSPVRDERLKKFNMARFIKLSRRPSGAPTDIVLKRPDSQINTQILNIAPEKADTVSERPVPSRVSERLSQTRRSRLPPWIQTQSKGKEETVEFSSDSRVESVQVQDATTH